MFKWDFNTGNNEKYKIEAIWDSAVYVGKIENHLPNFNYLITWKNYSWKEIFENSYWRFSIWINWSASSIKSIQKNQQQLFCLLILFFEWLGQRLSQSNKNKVSWPKTPINKQMILLWIPITSNKFSCYRSQQ